MTRWTRLAASLGAAVLTIGLVAPAAQAAEPPPDLPTGARLACRATLVDSAPKANCNWTVGAQEYGAVELWRGTGENGELTRVKVFETADHAVRHFQDTTIEVGKRYGYVLVVLGPEGNPRARSNLSMVGVAPPAELLSLTCQRAAERTIHCEWSAPTNPNATKITLWAIVNRDGRKVLTSLEPPAGGGFDFALPNGAWGVRIGLTATDATGQLVGRSPVLTFTIGRPRR